MPNCPSVWMAAGLLWVLDGTINASMQPFRALVADNLPEEQNAQGFAIQSLFIGLGGTVASALPWMMTNWFGVTSDGGGQIPHSVRLSFYIGAAAFMGAVPLYWPAPPNTLKTSAGMHRFAWDMHDDPIPGMTGGGRGGGGGANGAVPHRTYPGINSPWVAPGLIPCV